MWKLHTVIYIYIYNGDFKKVTFSGKDDIVNTFYTPPIHIKHNIKSMAGLSSVDTTLLSGLGDNVAKGLHY